jgi:precorrin-6B methylase 2
VPLPQPTRRFGFRPELQKNFIDIDFRSRPPRETAIRIERDALRIHALKRALDACGIFFGTRCHADDASARLEVRPQAREAFKVVRAGGGERHRKVLHHG